MDEMSATDIATAIRTGEVRDVVQDFGRVIGDACGRDAFFDVRLPNGQTFRIKVEEMF